MIGGFEILALARVSSSRTMRLYGLVDYTGIPNL